MKTKNDFSAGIFRSIISFPFFRGIASIFNFGGTLHQELRESPLEGLREDAVAIRGDWERVGQSLRWAMSQIRDEGSTGDLNNER